MRRVGEPFGAVIFDLDGVLVDAEIWWDEVRADFARRHDRIWTEADQAAIMGANSAGWSDTMRQRLRLAELTREEIEQDIVGAMVERYRTRGAPRIDGAVDALRRTAATLPIAVASSSPMVLIAAALASLGVAASFSAVVSSDEVNVGKPAPDVYLLAASRLGVDPAACLVVEDSANGVRAGRAAGMVVVLIPNDAVPPAPGAHEAASIVLGRIERFDVLELAQQC